MALDRPQFDQTEARQTRDDREMISFWVMLVAVLVFATFCFWQASALAHSFYPAECCSDRDCWPMGNAPDAKEPEPQFTRVGWKLSDGSIIAFNQTRPSPDGRFHVCRHAGSLNGSVIRPHSRPVCLFTPQQGS
jgi:hypothetical protein